MSFANFSSLPVSPPRPEAMSPTVLSPESKRATRESEPALSSLTSAIRVSTCASSAEAFSTVRDPLAAASLIPARAFSSVASPLSNTASACSRTSDASLLPAFTILWLFFAIRSSLLPELPIVTESLRAASVPFISSRSAIALESTSPKPESPSSNDPYTVSPSAIQSWSSAVRTHISRSPMRPALMSLNCECLEIFASARTSTVTNTASSVSSTARIFPRSIPRTITRFPGESVPMVW